MLYLHFELILILKISTYCIDYQLYVHLFSLFQQTLISFVESYRKLTRLPEPEQKTFSVQNLLDNIRILSRSFPNAEKIEILCETEPPEQQLLAEKKISQVMINLVKNAFQALQDHPEACIRITSMIDKNDRHDIKIIDNEPGIPDEIMDKIFIPIFTTKENGSGIGLSVSRQIMQLHGGTLRILSIPGEVVTAVLTFS